MLHHVLMHALNHSESYYIMHLLSTCGEPLVFPYFEGFTIKSKEAHLSILLHSLISKWV